MNAVASMSIGTWSPRRRAVAGVFGAVTLTVLALGATYLAGVTFLLLNRVHPRHAELASVAVYWKSYADDARRRKQIVFSIVVASATLLILPVAAVVAARPRRRLHGDARFATPAEVRNAGLLAEPCDRGPSILVGRFGGGSWHCPGNSP